MFVCSLFFVELTQPVGNGVVVVLCGAAPEPASFIHCADNRTLWRIAVKRDVAIG